MRIGVISDTHGYLDPRALAALQGVALILHAGDIGAASIVDALEVIAPVTAVYGNVDASTPLARRFPAARISGLARDSSSVGSARKSTRWASRGWTASRTT